MHASFSYFQRGETTIHESDCNQAENARYYAPDLGVFLTEDSYRGETGSVDTWNLYAYCNGNPVNYVDPSGQSPMSSKLKLSDYRVIHKCVQIAYMWKLIKRGAIVDMEVAVRNVKSKRVVGYLDLYDSINNVFYEVKFFNQCKKKITKVRVQMAKYEKAIILNYHYRGEVIKNIKKGSRGFTGSFYYGAWKVSYFLFNSGLVAYKTELNKKKQKVYKKIKQIVFDVTVAGVTIATATTTGRVVWYY